MKFLIGLISFIAFSATGTTGAAVNLTDFENNMIFYTINSQGSQLNFTFSNNNSFTQMCPPSSSNWTIVSHAWHESYGKQPWHKSIMGSFLQLRGGCVMFMDFGVYANLGYVTMVNYFEGMVKVVIRKFQQLEQLGYDPGNGYLFAYGFSSHLFFTGAFNYSPCTIGRLDSCDAAKPQYLNNSAPAQNARKSAKSVICHHTSEAYGTDLKYCQKDIDLGRCGLFQPASLKTPYTNHELCPYIYNNTFTIDFDIVPKLTVELYYKTKCFNKTTNPSLMPNEAIHIGPRMKTCIPNGEYYVLTSGVYPYNVKSNYTA